MTYQSFYSDGTVSLTNGSAAVTGTGTAWTFYGVTGGVLFVADKAYPVASVESDTELTLRRAATVTLEDADYDIGLVSSEQSTILRLNELQAQQLARGSLVRLNPDARGSLGGRDAYDAEGEGFIYGIIDNPPFYEFYEKASDTGGDWAGPFQWYGPEGDGARGDPGASDVVGTSASSVEIGTGTKTFTIVEGDRGWGVGARLRISSDADGENFMEGVVTSYSGSTLAMAIDLTSGAGTHDDWTINVAGLSGQSILYGNGAPSSALGGDGDHYIDRLNLDIYGPKDEGAWGSATPIITATFLQNVDGGDAESAYGGTTPIDGGDATPS